MYVAKDSVLIQRQRSHKEARTVFYVAGESRCLFVSWCIEPSQPLGVTTGLRIHLYVAKDSVTTQGNEVSNNSVLCSGGIQICLAKDSGMIHRLQVPKK